MSKGKEELQKKLGHRVYCQEEVNELFVLDEDQTPPYLRGRIARSLLPVILIKCEYKAGREDLFYIYRTGRAASHFSSEKRDPIKISLLPPERKSYWK